MKQKKYEKVIIIILSILIIIFVGLIVFKCVNKKYINTSMVSKTKDLISYQSELEKKIEVDGYTINKPNIILDPYDNSPLSALVLFETKSEVEPKLTVVGKDSNTTLIKKFPKGKKHYIEVLGLYPDKNNKIIIEYKEKDKNIKKELFIKTKKLPEGFILPKSVKAKKEKLGNEFYFFSPSGLNNAVAYDCNGDVRWYLTKCSLWDNKRLENGHIMVGTERLLNMPYYITGMYEIDMLGKIYNEYSLPGGYHHDYFEMENGNLLVLSNDFNNEYGTVEDYIVEVNRKTGKIVKTFDIKDVIPMDEGKSENWISYDWFHNNSIWYDKKTNSITLSGRHQDAVINIDYDSKKLNWIVGDKTNWSKEYHKYFFKPVGKDFEWQWSQHAAMITPEGYLFLLDNGNNKSKEKDKYVSAKNSYTRGVMYKLDKEKMTIEQIYQYGKERGSDFYSPYISDVDYLNKNHYIIHSGGIVKDSKGRPSNQPAGFVKNAKLLSDTVEVDDDEVIFEIKLPTNNYRVEKYNIYNDTNLELGNGLYKGSLGKTKVNKNKLGFIESKDNKKILEEHKVKFVKEKDRLVFNGQFKRGQEINVILYKNFNSKYYKIDVSKRPYTALCVDAFTEEENENGIMLTRYINEDRLNGKYSIYIEIDGVIYNTSLAVEF